MTILEKWCDAFGKIVVAANLLGALIIETLHNTVYQLFCQMVKTSISNMDVF